MTDVDDELERNAPGNRTIQVDALSDVELVDGGAQDDAAPPMSPTMSLPPPLPPKGAGNAPTKQGIPWVALIVTVVVTGALGALGAHFLVPHPEPPPAPLPLVAAPPEPEPVRRIELSGDLVITAGDPDAGE